MVLDAVQIYHHEFISQNWFDILTGWIWVPCMWTRNWALDLLEW